MAQTLLLSKHNAPLKRLSLHRLQLDQDEPTCTITTEGEEVCLYVLVGQIDLLIDQGIAEPVLGGVFGGRRAITEREGLGVMRFPAGHPVTVEVRLCDFSADVLLVSASGPASDASPVAHRGDIWAHQVGKGTHQREVREVPTAPGYAVSCGETLQQPGMVSSWPPHANADDITKFRTGGTTWEEVFWIAAPAPGIAVLDGYYSDGIPTRDIIRLENGCAYPMPLGSHLCYAAPDSYLYYAWFYVGDALRKVYRKYADDVGVYRK